VPAFILEKISGKMDKNMN